ncbi:DUF6890 family protein [Hahella ganghwensis]|uniref:DUF6890 family protein n=1 Tax=Hahella ganghwensis TaxID=286420 RepID=UPI003CCBF91E
MSNNGYDQLRAYATKWCPGQPQNEQVLGLALFLETNYWEKHAHAVANGIAKALKG